MSAAYIAKGRCAIYVSTNHPHWRHADAPQGAFSLTKLFDRANEQERLYGLRMDGVWMHVGTPDAIAAAEDAFLASVA